MPKSSSEWKGSVAVITKSKIFTIPPLFLRTNVVHNAYEGEGDPMQRAAY